MDAVLDMSADVTGTKEEKVKGTKLTGPALDRINILRGNMMVEPEVCIEKAKFTTESFRSTEGAPVDYRRAMALDNILSNITIGIGDGELIVGRPTGKVRGGPLSPEVNATWYTKEMDTFHTREQENYAAMSEEDKAIVRDCCDYWSGKSLFDHWKAAVPEDMQRYNGPIIGGGGFCLNTQYVGHISTDFNKMITKGVTGLYDDIDKSIDSIGTFADIENFKKIQYLKAMKISLGAIVKFANRYADLAEQMAEQEQNPKRKAELERIAETCRHVPEHPARTMAEALQATWFTYVALNNESWGAGPSLSRADQYLYPFYLADKEAGRLTDEEALEYLASFLIKQNGQFTVYSTPAAKIYGGLCCRLGTTIGGLKEDGACAVNELSYLFMEAARHGLTEDIMVLTGENTPKDFTLLALETAAILRGKMKFIGQDVLVKQLLHDGRPNAAAYGCAITGCNSPSSPGYSLDLPGGMTNLALIFDLALHDGYSPTMKQQMGPHTGDARNFTSYEEVFDAFKKQFAYFVPYMHLYKNVDKQMFADYSPSLVQSSLMRGCIEKAQDIMRGAMAPYISYSMSMSGAPNVGDSLAALKKLIFEDGKYSMSEMLDAIDANFEGHDELLHAIQRAPKFGNDEPYVDQLVDDVLSFVSSEVEKYPGPFGAKSTIAVATITANIPMGGDVGALPDGRKAGQPLAEGGISPHQGRNTNGVTATMASVARLNAINFRHGSVLNVRIDPEAVKDSSKMEKLSTMVSAFHKMGGFLVQFNIVSTHTLKEAQKDPEQYKDLLVRVSTYSAYFVELSKSLQDDIIARMEFGSV